MILHQQGEVLRLVCHRDPWFDDNQADVPIGWKVRGRETETSEWRILRRWTGDQGEEAMRYYLQAVNEIRAKQDTTK